MDDYRTLVAKSARLNPALDRVLSFMSQGLGSTDNVSAGSFHTALINYVEHSGTYTCTYASNPLDGMHASLQSLERAIKALVTTAGRPPVLLVQDIQPECMLYLGDLLRVDPNVFEHYLNRDASFQTFDADLLVFDYPETFLYGDGRQVAEAADLFKPSRITGRGTLTKVWMNVYAYTQRILRARVLRPSPHPDIYLLLVDSLPRTKDATYHFAQKPSVMWKQVSFPTISAKPSDCFTQLQDSIVQPAQGSASDKPDAAAVVESVSSKWQTLLYYAQSKISESKAPLSGDVHLVAEVIQRKHDFEKMQRVMQADTESAAMLLGVGPTDEKLVELHSYGTVIGSWATQLEKVAASLLGLLAIQESLKASKQAIRTQNLTILAFIFIPVSTVSSIYGMNTVEIAQHNPHMWQFGLTAAVTTIVAILAASFYQYWATLPKSLFSMFRRRSRLPRPLTFHVDTDPSTAPANNLNTNQQHAIIPHRPPKQAPLVYPLQTIPLATSSTTADFLHPDSPNDSELGEVQANGGPPLITAALLDNSRIASSQCAVM